MSSGSSFAMRHARSTRRVVSTVAVIIVATLFVTLAATMGIMPGPAGAASQCVLNSSGQSYFDGFMHNPYSTAYNFEGASASIVVRDGTLCSSPSNPSTNMTTSWVMIADRNGKGWAQVGFMRRGDKTGLRWFSQSVRRYGEAPNTWISSYSVSAEIGRRHTFRVLWDPACLCEKSIIDSSTVAWSTFNPFGNWTTPFLPTFSGETKNLKSDITGFSWARTSFTSLAAQKYDDLLMTMPCTLLPINDNPARWSQSMPRCDAVDIWTAVY